MKRFIIKIIARLRDLLYYLKYFFAFSNNDGNQYILFDSYAGKTFGDNPYYIFFKLLNSNYKLVWVFNNEKMINEFNKTYPNHLAIKYKSLAHFKYLKKASYWIFNYKTPPYFIKKDSTIFIQTWHGIPLKKLGNDLENTNQTFYRSMQSYQQMANSYSDEGKKCDYFISPTSFSSNKFSSAFNFDKNKIIESNYPRNELLLNHTSSDIKKIKEELNISEGKKIILYAPTYRDNNSNLLNGYQSNYVLDFLKAKTLLENYIILYKPHYLISNTLDINNESIIDVSNYSKLDNLMIISDILITDYSSIYFDYSLLKRPIHFYMPDLFDYKDNLRGFYIDIDNDLPNNYYENVYALEKAILNNSVNKNKQKHFYEKFSYYELNYEKILSIIKNES